MHMKRCFYYLGLFACLLSLTSCSAMLQGMAAGMSGYGGYGYGMYAPYAAAPMGYYPAAPSLPSQAQMQQQVEAAKQQIIQNTIETAKSAQQAKAMIEAQAAYNVQHGITPVAVDYSNSSSSTSSSSSSSSSSTSSKSRYGYKDCTHCMGNGKCSSCNGTGFQDHMRSTLCGVCSNHNGKCIWCSGSGKRYGAL